MDAKKSYVEVVAKLRTAEAEFQSLVKKLDDLEGQTSALKSKIEACEVEEKAVYDSYFLGKAAEKNLNDIRKKTQAAKDAISAHSKMIESLNRCIQGKEREIAGLRKQIDSLRHQVWQRLFEAKAAAIPENIRQAVRELITIGLNCSIGRDHILPKIFTMPTNSEIQQIYKRLSADTGIE